MHVPDNLLSQCFTLGAPAMEAGPDVHGRFSVGQAVRVIQKDASLSCQVISDRNNRFARKRASSLVLDVRQPSCTSTTPAVWSM